MYSKIKSRFLFVQITVVFLFPLKNLLYSGNHDFKSIREFRPLFCYIEKKIVRISFFFRNLLFFYNFTMAVAKFFEVLIFSLYEQSVKRYHFCISSVATSN